MLQQLNKLKSSTICLGQKLKVPAASPKTSKSISDSKSVGSKAAATTAATGASAVSRPQSQLSEDFMVIAADGTPWEITSPADNTEKVEPEKAKNTAKSSKNPPAVPVSAAVNTTEAKEVKTAASANASLHPGWRFRPPTFSTKATYTVKKGDTLSEIASLFGSTVSELMGVNGLKSSMIKIGQVIKVPQAVDRKVVSRSWPGDFDRNVWLLARVIHGEARGEPYEGQVAVGAVVLNRLVAGFGKTIDEVIRQKNAFTAVQDGQYRLRPSYTSIKAAQEALEGWDPSGGALYYYNPKKATAKWSFNRPQIKRIGDHIFTL